METQITVSLSPITLTVNERSSDVSFLCNVGGATKSRYSPTVAGESTGGQTGIPILDNPSEEVGDNHLLCTCSDGQVPSMYLYIYDGVPYYLNDLTQFNPQAIEYTEIPPNTGPTVLTATTGGDNNWVIGVLGESGDEL